MTIANKRDFTHYLLLTFILVSAAVLRLMMLGGKSLWADEGVIWYMALGAVHYDAPPIYYVLYNWSISLFGWNEFAGRLPSALFGWACVPLVYFIGKVTVDRKYGLYCALVAGISVFLIPLSQEMRIYSIVGFETLLALWIFLRIVRDERAHFGWWFGLLIIGVIGQYSHCFFIFILGYFGLTYFAVHGRRSVRGLILFISMIAAILILSVPQLSTTASVIGSRQHMMASDFAHLLANILQVMRSYFSFLFGNYSVGFIKVVMVIAWLLFVIQGLRKIAASIKADDFQALFMKMMLGMIIVFTLLYFVVDVSTAGHLIFIYVPFLFVVAGALASFRRKRLIAILTLFILLSGITLIDYYKSPTYYYDRSDWRSAGLLLSQQFENDDALLILGARNAYYTLKFYHPALEGDIYYRPRHDRELSTDDELIKWWQRSTTIEKVQILLKDHSRVWIASLNNFSEKEITAALHEYQTWDFGPGLQYFRFDSK